MNDKMHLYNFYISDDLKRDVVEKLTKELGKTEKGAMSALLRILLKQYIASPADTKLISEVAKEYTTSATRNKRSRL